MNLLAHAYLTPPDAPAGLLVGNLTADFIKGRARLALPPDLQRGIALHRRIDAFTDIHPLVLRTADLLYPRWGRYASVLVDIFFDHLLAADWSARHATPLPAFTTSLYATLRDHLPLLPERAVYAMTAMIADDWLTPYATLDGIRLALTRMSRRLRLHGHDIELAPAVDDFLPLQPAFSAAFTAFLPALMAHLRPLAV